MRDGEKPKGDADPVGVPGAHEAAQQDLDPHPEIERDILRERDHIPFPAGQSGTGSAPSQDTFGIGAAGHLGARQGCDLNQATL